MDQEKRPLLVFGCGGHSRSVTDVILLNDPDTQIVFVDENARENEKIYGFEVVRDIPTGSYTCFVAIGDNVKRKKMFAELREARHVSVISKRAHLGHRSQLGIGCFVGNFCHIGPDASIGENTILNTACVVEHEVVVGAHSHIGPNATISGRCKIGELVFIGVGATVKDYINICSHVVVGAGATVVKDITEPGVYVGTPARRIK